MSISGDEAAKKQRTHRACDSCRKKRVKCDGESPVCTNCQESSVECTYKDTTKKRGPPVGYTEAIEMRLARLEKYFNKMADDNVFDTMDDPETRDLIEELSAPLMTSTGELIRSTPKRRKRVPKNMPSAAIAKSAERSQRESSADSLLSPELFDSPSQPSNSNHQQFVTAPSSPTTDSVNDSTGQLSMDESGQVRYLGRSSGFYYLQNSRTYQNGVFHFSGYYHKMPIRMQNKNLTDLLEMPPKDLSDHLLGIYFIHFYPFLPLFYKRHLVLSTTPFESISPLLLNAIYALASRMSPDVRVRSDQASQDTAGDIFFERAKQLLDGYYDTPKISTVQALLLMASHQIGVAKGARAWLYSGMAFRMAQDLGLNRNCDHWNISPEQRERRKRVFWCCFVIDRLTSASYGRSATFEERDCDVPFPSVDDDEKICSLNPQSERQPASVLEIFTNLIKICDILGNVLKNIYYANSKQHTASPKHIDHILIALHRQLIQWQKNLPSSVEYHPPNTQNGEETPDPHSSICQLHMIYYTTMILLHRSFIPGPTQTHLSSSFPSYNICESAATSILDISINMLRENHLKYAYNFTVYYILTAGIIFIKLASSDDPRRMFDAKILINRAMRALDDLETTWLNAARACNILGELAGLRDINLECDEYVPRKIQRRSPPPSIAVPNSPDTDDDDDNSNDDNTGGVRDQPRILNNKILHQPSPKRKELPLPFNQYSQVITNNNFIHNESSVRTQSMPIEALQQQQQQRQQHHQHQHQHHHNNNNSNNNRESHLSSNSTTSSTSNIPSTPYNTTIKPTMDPFAAPEIIPVQQSQFDPLGTVFWGVPSSFDMDEWNAYFDSLNPQNQNVSTTTTTTTTTGTTGTTANNNNSSSQVGISSLIMAPNEFAASSYIFDHVNQRRSSRDQGDSNSLSQSLLFNFLDNL